MIASHCDFFSLNKFCFHIYLFFLWDKCNNLEDHLWASSVFIFTFFCGKKYNNPEDYLVLNIWNISEFNNCLLVVAGRAPNTKRLNLEDVGVELDKIGAIKVSLCLSTPWIFLIFVFQFIWKGIGLRIISSSMDFGDKILQTWLKPIHWWMMQFISMFGNSDVLGVGLTSILSFSDQKEPFLVDFIVKSFSFFSHS